MTIGKSERPGDTAEPESPPITFRLDPHSGVPTYLQLVHQVEHALRLGVLVLGDQLPKIKDVVATLAINPNTVLKAYRDLEQKGIARGRPGQGTFIEVAPETASVSELAGLRSSFGELIARASQVGLDSDSVVALFNLALRDFHDRPLERGGEQTGTQSKGVA